MNKKSSIRFFKYSIFILLFYHLIFAQSDNHKIKFKHLTVDQGLSHTWIIDILKDSRNFMWFAAANGLNKYDGYKFEVFQHTHDDITSLPQSLVTDLFEDSQGVIWIATGEGLSRYNRDTNNFRNYYPDSSSTSILGRMIQAIVEDSKGRLWISTSLGLNLYHRETDDFTRFRYGSQNIQQIAPVSPIGAILSDEQNILWIGTLDHGLIRFDTNTKTFVQYILGDNSKSARSNSSVTSLQLEGNNLWVGTLGNGLFKFDIRFTKGNKVVQYKHDPHNPESLSNDNVMSLLYQSKDKIWVGTENYGLDLFNSQTGKFLHHLPESNNPYSLNNGSIYSLYSDSSNNLWVGTYSGGVNVSFVNLQDFEVYRGIAETKNSMNCNIVTSFIEDKQDNLWIGTDGGGLNYMDRDNNTFKVYSSENTNLKSDAIQSFAYDSKGNLWLSAWEGGISRFDKSDTKFYSISTENGLPDNNVISFLIDSEDRIWAGCFFSGLVLLNKNHRVEKIYNHTNSGLQNESVRILHQDKNKNIIIGTDEGIFFFNPVKDTFKWYKKNPNNPNSLSGNQIYAITEQRNGIFWFGTGFGLNRFDPVTEKFSHFYKENGLPSNRIVGLIFDHNDDLWISTDKGIAKMDIEKKVFKTYTISDGLQGNQFNINSQYRTNRNEILFGGKNGFNLFHPDSLKKNTAPPQVVLTDFQIFNRAVNIGEDEPLKKHISVAESIDLSYKESVFSFSFSALSYEAPECNQYAYMMEGFDEDWIYAGNNRHTTYTNLSPGKYIFKVKASNNDGVWNEKGASIKIYIHPPFWQTVWFRVFMILLILGIIAIFHLFRINIEKSRSRRLERRVQERTQKLKALNDELESFAYSVSHDLRAPLRSITGFSDIIEEDYSSSLPEDVKKYLIKIKTAGLRMGFLIEDLLKLTRIRRVEMEIRQINLSDIVQQIVKHLKSTDPDRKVNFKIQSNVTAVADKQLAKILLENLINNAWKYTSNESEANIEFGVNNDKSKTVYFVSDNGVGFDMQYADKLYIPFMRLHKEKEFEGTGIGLATVKRIIDRHGGNIWAQSEPGKGTIIFFSLKM